MKIKDYLEEDINEDADSKRPKMMFQGMDVSLLVKIATGKLDAKEYAKYELQNIGYGKKGEWIGFPEAEKLWKSKVK